MRKDLEDIAGHSEDPTRLAQKHARPALPRRFYQRAEAAAIEGGFTVTLDGRSTRTPGRVPVVVPNEEVAAIMAAEWEAQGAEIDPETMPMVRLVNAALEGGEGAMPALRAEILNYVGSDLLLYRADGPESLVAAQEAAWDAALVSLARRFGVGFQPTIGIRHQPQPESTLSRMAETLEGEGLLALTALASITGLTGSGLLALALRYELTTPDEAWAAAHVDEDHQARLWGEVPEAVERRRKRRQEFDAAVRLIGLMPAPGGGASPT